MLYLLDVEIDYARMGDRVQEIRAAEHARVTELIAEGIVKIEWLKASGRGVYAVWDCVSHEHLRQMIASVPIVPSLTHIDLHPLRVGVFNFCGFDTLVRFVGWAAGNVDAAQRERYLDAWRTLLPHRGATAARSSRRLSRAAHA